MTGDRSVRDVVQSCVDSMRKDHGIPGVAVVAFSDERIIAAVAGGRRSVEDDAPVTLDTLFRLHSMTKMVTSVAVLRLRDLGRLELDSPLAELSPVLTGSAPELLGGLTVAQLMSHTSGLPDGPTEIAQDSRDPAGLSRQTARLAANLTAVARPGRVYSYSNYAYSVLGAALEELTGLPFAQLVADLVAEPLGLTSLCLDPITAMTYPLSQQHLLVRGELTVDHWYGESTRMYPAAMAFMSPNDLAQLGRMYLCGGLVPGTGERFLSSDCIAEQHRRRVDIGLVDDRHYGLGTYVGPRVGAADCVGHEGFFTGMWCDLVLYPAQRFGIAWCDNRGDERELSNARRAAIEAIGQELGVPRHRLDRPAAPRTADETSFPGTYTRRAARPIRVDRDEHGLHLRLGRTVLPLSHHAGTVYRADVPPELAGRAPLSPHSGSSTPSVSFHLGLDAAATHLSINGILYRRES